MDKSKNILHCLSCGRSEQQTPLVNLQYSGEQLWVCPQCLPILIHQPEKLADKIPGIQATAAPPHRHK